MIRRAQMYMEKLSHGINPLDGTPVADGDLIRNGRMSRCFAFVAEVLDKVVTNSAPHAEKPQPAAPKSAPAAPAQSGPRSLPPELAAMPPPGLLHQACAPHQSRPRRRERGEAPAAACRTL